MRNVKSMGTEPVLNGFSFTLMDDRINCILFENHLGIRELEDIFGGSLGIASGEIIIDNKKMSPGKKSGVSVIFSDPSFFPGSSVFHNIFLTSPDYTILRKGRLVKRYRDMMAEFHLDFPAGANISHLSHSDKRIIELLRCISLEPHLIVLCDILAGVPYSGQLVIKSMLHKIKESGTGILLLTSKWEDAVFLGESIALCSGGQNSGIYTPEEIVNDPRSVYVKLTGHSGDEDANQAMSFFPLNVFPISYYEQDSVLTIGPKGQNAMKYLAQQIRSDLSALSATIYIVDKRFHNMTAFCSDPSAERYLLRNDVLYSIIDNNSLFFQRSTQQDFELLYRTPFEKDMHLRSCLCMPASIQNNICYVTQISFPGFYLYSYGDVNYLKDIGHEIAAQIETYYSNDHSVLLHESHHRIKNNLQTVISLIQLQKDWFASKGMETISFSELEGFCNSISSRIKSVAAIHDLLAKDNGTSDKINVNNIITKIADFYNTALPMNIDLQFENLFVPHGNAVSLALLLNELISNSIKHNAALDRTLNISISFFKKNNKFELHYKDNGCGFPDNFDISGNTGTGTMIIQSVLMSEATFDADGTAHTPITCYNKDGACSDITFSSGFFLA